MQHTAIQGIMIVKELSFALHRLIMVPRLSSEDLDI